MFTFDLLTLVKNWLVFCDVAGGEERHLRPSRTPTVREQESTAGVSTGHNKHIVLLTLSFF